MPATKALTANFFHEIPLVRRAILVFGTMLFSVSKCLKAKGKRRCVFMPLKIQRNDLQDCWLSEICHHRLAIIVSFQTRPLHKHV
jgi:hypothetical protein